MYVTHLVRVHRINGELFWNENCSDPLRPAAITPPHVGGPFAERHTHLTPSSHGAARDFVRHQ